MNALFGSGEGKNDFNPVWVEALASAPTAVDAAVAPADLVAADGPDGACVSDNTYSPPA